MTSIEWAAFSGCTSLTTITICSGINRIDGYAFGNCPKLTDVFCMAESVPSTESDAYDDSHIENATLHVPETAIDAYKAAEPWKNFKSIVGIESGVNQVMANAVLIQSERGCITVNGVDDGTNVSIYSTDGVLTGSAICRNGSAVIKTSLQVGSLVIVKIGEKSVKIVVQ
jgi:hypothetical protein